MINAHFLNPFVGLFVLQLGGIVAWFFGVAVIVRAATGGWR